MICNELGGQNDWVVTYKMPWNPKCHSWLMKSCKLIIVDQAPE